MSVKLILNVEVNINMTHIVGMSCMLMQRQGAYNLPLLYILLRRAMPIFA